MARYSWPYEYEFRDELPKTLVGKVAYNVLIHEEEAKYQKRTFDKAEDKEIVTVEVVQDEFIDKMKEDK